MDERIQDFEVNSPRWLSLENFDGEVWKDIPDYKGWYQVSNMGRIKSIDRLIKYTPRKVDGKSSTRLTRGTILKASFYGEYLICHLKKNNTSKAVVYHRIVCSVFHPNPNNLPEVNHINEIKIDNRASNLEWCDRKYNINWGTALERSSRANRNHPAKSHIVYQYSMDGSFINKFPSAKEAERQTGISATNILSVCRDKKQSSSGGYIWSFNQDPTIILRKIKRKLYGLSCYSKKKVKQFSLSGEYLKTFDSISDAAKQTKAHLHNISLCCQHVHKHHSTGGYKWEWDDTPESEWLVKKKSLLRVHRPIICKNANGDLVAEFKNIAEAAKKLHLFTSGISRCCNGINSHCGGYVFSFKDE